MSKALFFNALPDDTGWDRKYNADDLSDFLSMVCDTGVVKTNTVSNEPQGLKVVKASGMVINVNAGKAVIKGKAFINDALETFTVAANGSTSTRYDYLVIKYDNNVSVRDIKLELRTGTSTIPTAAVLAQNNGERKVYELMLAYIAVAPSATSIAQAQITDTRGDADLCPWFTAVKGYEDYYDAAMQTYESSKPMEALGTTVVTDLPSKLYDERYSLIEVYTNGIKERESAYAVSTSSGYIVITFTAAKAAGAVITVKLDNFIDGEGMSTALAEYNAFTQAVADMQTANEYNYICNGVNDNVLISNIVKAFYSVNDQKSLKLNVIGNIGMTAAAGGSGTTSNPNAWFDFTKQAATDRTVTIDFSNCSAINVPVADGTANYVFKAEELKVIGANIIVSNIASGTTVKVFDTYSGRIAATNCRFWLTCYQDAKIAYTGTFTNCRGSVTNVTNNTFCYNPADNGLVRVYGGEYYAYTGDANYRSAVVGQSGANAVAVLYGVNAPTVARTNYYQTHAIYQVAGGGMVNCTDLISALPLNVQDGASNVRGTIAKSKPNLM